ncbi:MAG TPA: response regulator [Gemmatimonadales bacterium]|nr:response regulator [Gemmatimonadales bacterium]
MATPLSAPRNASPGSRRTVLYVEDHPVNALLMQALFAKRPAWHLVVATTGEAGWEAALADPPVLLLLDLHLPDCHGAELLARLRTVPALADVPAVAVTADVTRDVRCDGFLELWRKPMDVPATLARLDALLPETADAGTSVAAGPAWPGSAGHARAAVGRIPFSPLAED